MEVFLELAPFVRRGFAVFLFGPCRSPLVEEGPVGADQVLLEDGQVRLRGARTGMAEQTSGDMDGQQPSRIVAALAADLHELVAPVQVDAPDAEHLAGPGRVADVQGEDRAVPVGAKGAEEVVPPLVGDLARSGLGNLGVVADPAFGTEGIQWIVMSVRLPLRSSGTGLTSGPCPVSIQNS
ncbi:hypothetical protein ACFZDK_50255 [Streptomyces sp. NPDC007901]|uniref:hypothetical protein n=1 Tax=Streptomyces sp. NPDC007901 TaxID=3364785 RepID=UPI0036E69BDA